MQQSKSIKSSANGGYSNEKWFACGCSFAEMTLCPACPMHLLPASFSKKTAFAG
jgi:hypothetical protein